MNLQQVKRYILVAIGLLVSSIAYGACDTSNVTQTTPDSEFVDHDDGTLSHAKTGLMWAQCSEGTSGSSCSGNGTLYNWRSALLKAESSSRSGYTDWRLPSIKELLTLVENSCLSPAINGSIFPGTKNSNYWSSSTYSSNQTNVWVLNFAEGSRTNKPKDDAYFIRLVRDID